MGLVGSNPICSVKKPPGILLSRGFFHHKGMLSTILFTSFSRITPISIYKYMRRKKSCQSKIYLILYRSIIVRSSLVPRKKINLPWTSMELSSQIFLIIYGHIFQVRYFRNILLPYRTSKYQYFLGFLHRV